MLHQDENKWSRNLVVASAFGLSPSNSIYEGLAFRDSYQTALYNTIKKVLYNNNSDKDSDNKNNFSKDYTPTVKTFEIGNKSAVDYSHDDQCENIDQNQKRCDYTEHKALYLGLSFGVFILLMLQTNNRARITISSIAFIFGSVAIALQFFDLSNNKEFYALFSGTSVWPAYIIRMMASATAIIFILYTLISLKRNSLYIIKQHNLSDIKCIGFKDQLRDKLVTSTDYFIKTLTISFLQSLKWFFQYKCYNQDIIKNRNFTKIDVKSYFFLTSWGWKEKDNSKMPLDNLFYQYMQLSQARYRLPRVIFISALYFILTIIFLFSFPNLPITPFVGETSATANVIIIKAFLIPYIFLIFLVSDITRLSSRFITLLSKYSIVWPTSVLEKCCTKYGLNKKVATEKLNLDLIVTRSKVVDELIFLPFIILTLIILSRSSYFDRWHMPLELAFVLVFGACFALGSAIRLRKTAQKARKQTLKKLNKMYHQQLYNEVEDNMNEKGDFGINIKNMSSRIKNVIDDIENISSGPFLPIAQHPILSAVAMPFGGMGGLYLIDYVSSFGL
jgi:hypothetical protein